MLKISDIRRHRQAILDIACRHGASDVRVFGSVARGQSGKGSDLDLLVRMDEDRSLLDHVALMQDLEDLLNASVDVVNERSLHHLIRDTVLRESQPL